MDMTDNLAVVTENLTKRFGGFTAVDHVNFSVPRGDIFGFLGPNGAGKTTTIRMLLGLLKPTEGHASVLGFDIAHQARQVQQHVGYMSQLFSLYGDLTVMENLNFYGKTYGLSKQLLEQRQEYALNMTGLYGQENDLTKNLAGGFRQRLALACAILHDPKVVFLDEPTAGVDPISRRTFWDFLYGLAEEGRTIFVTTHYMDEAENCRHLIFINSGRIVLQGTPAEIKEHMSDQILEIDCDKPELALSMLREAKDAGRLPVGDLSLYGTLIHATTSDTNTASLQPELKQFLGKANITVRAIDTITPSLEDAFIASMKESERTQQ